MKKSIKKLTLSRETLLTLTTNLLENVAGGVTAKCDSDSCSTCDSAALPAHCP